VSPHGCCHGLRATLALISPPHSDAHGDLPPRSIRRGPA